MDGHIHFTVLLCQNAVKCERVTFAGLSLTLHFNGPFGRDSGGMFPDSPLHWHCAERSRVSVEFAGSNDGVKGSIQIDGQTWFSFDKNTAFHTAREWHSQTSSNLFFVDSKKANGDDTYGHYNATVLSWSMSEGSKRILRLRSDSTRKKT